MTGNMSAMTNLIISTIVAAWVVTLALLSVQNASIVSLKFVFWQSIDLPWGLVLAGAVGFGFIIGGCLPLLSSNDTATKR
jgi:lipopolysaccharide assembly protein A